MADLNELASELRESVGSPVTLTHGNSLMVYVRGLKQQIKVARVAYNKAQTTRPALTPEAIVRTLPRKHSLTALQETARTNLERVNGRNAPVRQAQKDYYAKMEELKTALAQPDSIGDRDAAHAAWNESQMPDE